MAYKIDSYLLEQEGVSYLGNGNYEYIIDDATSSDEYLLNLYNIKYDRDVENRAIIRIEGDRDYIHLVLFALLSSESY